MKEEAPAFPVPFEIAEDMRHLGEPIDQFAGMSKRFFAACMAMQGLLSNSYPDIVRIDDSIVCEMSFKIADQMIKQEGEK